MKTSRQGKFESLINKRNYVAEIIMGMCEVKMIVEKAKERTVLEIKNKKKEPDWEMTVSEVVGIFRDRLRKEFSSILTPEMIAANYVVSVITPIEIQGKHYMIKFTIPSTSAFISFVETKIGMNEIIDKILQLIN
ncbi:MAG: hypothetical protein RMI01_09845 [Thermodesulfovibrio sp.]|nr:hypothetical protein [Thermodesulfovibrio sp.]